MTTNNPYSTPADLDVFEDASAQVKAPAIALLIAAILSLVVGGIVLVADAVFIITGMVARLEEVNEGPISEYVQIAVRATWGLALVFASSFVLYGATRMLKLRNYSTARSASVVAMIPMVGPCCILGIPFGIWAFVVLSKPDVRDSFS